MVGAGEVSGILLALPCARSLSFCPREIRSCDALRQSLLRSRRTLPPTRQAHWRRPGDAGDRAEQSRHRKGKAKACLVSELPKEFSSIEFNPITFSSAVRTETLCTWARFLIDPEAGWRPPFVTGCENLGESSAKSLHAGKPLAVGRLQSDDESHGVGHSSHWR